MVLLTACAKEDNISKKAKNVSIETAKNQIQSQDVNKNNGDIVKKSTDVKSSMDFMFSTHYYISGVVKDKYFVIHNYDKRYGVMDNSGKIVVIPMNYDSVEILGDGLLLLKGMVR